MKPYGIPHRRWFSEDDPKLSRAREKRAARRDIEVALTQEPWFNECDGSCGFCTELGASRVD